MSTEQTTVTDFTDKAAGYRELVAQLTALLAGEHDLTANAANTAALLFNSLPDVNWAGFYFLQPGPRSGQRARGLEKSGDSAGGELVLGPFQGRPACVRIALGRGVCGTAAVRRETVLVPDVHAFPGHIACDAASASEIVVPLVREDRLLGVLDLDSPLPGRFDAADRDGLQQAAAVFLRSLAF